MFIFLDTETTGNEPGDRLCQIAYKAGDQPPISGLFNPGKKISIDAMVVHHITDKMVEDKPAFTGSPEHEQLLILVKDKENVVVAHNASFDMGMLHKKGIYTDRVICTLKLARHLDKNGVIPKYNLQYLRYYLGLEVDAKTHDAAGDIAVLEALFERLHTKIVEQPGIGDPIQEMIRISNNPVLILRIPLGKHRGTHFKDIPRDYLEWLSGTELDEDMEYTVKHYLSIFE